MIDALAVREDTLFIISTDLSHFHDYPTASTLDRQTCERILAGATNLTGEQACGASPVNGFLASHTGKDYDTIAADCERDYWLDAEESVTYGVADQVLNRLPDSTTSDDD